MGRARVEWHGEQFLRALGQHLEGRADAIGQLVTDDMRSRAPRAAGPGHMPGGGHAADSIAYEVTTEPDLIRIRSGAPDGAFYLLFAEEGTSHQPATPWARPAVFENGPAILRTLGGA